MTERWLLDALAAGALLGLAARAAEPVAGWFRLPRRWTWAAAMAGSLLLPTLALIALGLLPELRLPSWPAHAVERGGGQLAPTAAGTETQATGEAAPTRTLPAAAGIVWLAASLATLGALGWSRRRLRMACGPCVGRRVAGVRVLVSERAGPMVLGLLEPQIILPRWALEAPEDCGLIVRHEREHVLAGDPWLLALASLAVAAMPWSPALWWQHRRLRLAVETDCDARVLAGGESRHRYGRLLLSTATRPLIRPAATLAWGGPSSHLERRLLAMTAQHPRHRILRAVPLAILTLAGAAAACGVASSGPRAESGRTQAAVDTTTRTEMWNGRVSTSKDLADGTTHLTLGPDPASPGGNPGFGWRYDYKDHPMHIRPGDRLPARSTVYPSVDRVLPGGPADKAGLRVGDVILSSNGVDGREYPLIPDAHPGTEYTFRVRSGNQERDVRLVLAGPVS